MSGTIGFDGGESYSGGGYTSSGGTTGDYVATTTGGAPTSSLQAYNQYVMDNYTSIAHMDTSSYNDVFFNNNINAANPYEKYVDIDGRYVTDNGLAKLYNSGNVVTVASSYERYNPQRKENFTEYVYRIYNNAFTEFEQSITSAQNTQATSIAERELGEVSSQINTNLIATQKDYGSNAFGDTQAIDTTAQNIGLLEYEMARLTLEDTLSLTYNRIADTNNAQRISELNAQLEAEKYALDVLKNEYEQGKRDFIREIMKNSEGTGLGSGDKSFWKVGYSWLFEPPHFDFEPNAFVEVVQDTQGFFDMQTTQEMGRWMAGGDLYDAPRAGDVAFSPIGNLNTVRFLGIKDMNKTSDMMLSHLNSELFMMFAPFGGDDNFRI